MTDNKVIAVIRVYHNPLSNVYSMTVWEGNEEKETVSGDINAISDCLFCLGLSLEDTVHGGKN